MLTPKKPTYEELEQKVKILEDTFTVLEQAKETLRQQGYFLQEIIDSIPNPLFVKDENAVYIACNKAFESFIGMESAKIIGKTVYDIAPKELADKYHEMDRALLHEKGVQTYEYSVVDSNRNTRIVQFNKATFKKIDGSLAGLVGIIFDITDRKQMEEDKENLIIKLQTTLDEIKTLKGIIPICMYCKGVRDDMGAWKKLEKYIVDHSDAQFSHGICDECMKKYHPEDIAE